MAIYKNSPPIVTSGLVLHLDAANKNSYTSGSAIWRDLSGNKNSGSLVNSPTYTTNNGGALVFNGSNNYINFTNSSSVNTINIWLNPYIIGNYPIIYTGNDVFNTTQWSWCIYAFGDALYFRGNSSGGSPLVITPLPTNKWNNWTMIRNDSSNHCVLYNNGIYYGFSVDSTLVNDYSGLRIGKAGSNYFSGSISQISMYNKALTASEVLQNYNAMRGRYN